MERRSPGWKALVLMAFLPLARPLTAQSSRPRVEINTTMGRMVVALNNETPLHRDNFLKLVQEHYYDSTLFYRVIPGFTIQGGDPGTRNAPDHNMVLGDGGPGYTIKAETNRALINKKGALVAARPTDRSDPEKRSHGSQFFLVDGQDWSPGDLQALVQKRNTAEPDVDHAYTPDQMREYATNGGLPKLDGNYTVFGEVVEGMDVLDLITAVPCDGRDRPMTDVRMWMRVLP